MKIKEIKLLTNDIEATIDFYHKLLGIPVVSNPIDSVTFQIGESRLTFTKNETHIDPYYHFAINITQDKVQNAINWLHDHGISINKVNNKDVVHSQSWNSDSVYFYDSIGNIVEFIARHNMKNPGEKAGKFNCFDLMNISEIGLPATDVITLTEFIQEQYNEQVYLSNDSLFSPIGDEEGLFILSSVERKWLGSDKKVEIFPLEVIIVSGRDETRKLLNYPYTIKTEKNSRPAATSL